MELYQTTDIYEKSLSDKADVSFTPIGGTIELLPLCNMDCKMCYIRKTKEEMDEEGRMLSCDEWLRIVDEGMNEGLLFLLLTGGEPLIYPEFKRLYSELKARGLILSVNTNGTLIDEEWADFFAKQGCRRLSITLYGTNDEEYNEICGNPNGFTQVMKAAQLLRERRVPFRFTCSITPGNVEKLEQIHRLAEQMQIPISIATYMFPAIRKGKKACEQYRLTPEQQAEATFRVSLLNHPGVSEKELAYATARELSKTPYLHTLPPGFTCKAGRSGFWMNWKGYLLPCGMFDFPGISLLEHSFKESWNRLVRMANAQPKCAECLNCPKQNVCKPCLAMNYAETGRMDGCPEYLCQSTDALLNICLEKIEQFDGKKIEK